MGDRTIELTITNGWDEAETERAKREFFMLAERLEADLDLDRYVFDAHDEAGNEYIVVIRNEPSEELWAKLWQDGTVDIVIDRAFTMRAIPRTPEVDLT